MTTIRRIENGATYPDRYLTFHGQIRAPATTSLRVALTQMVNEGAKTVTVLFSSEGGSPEDGIALYTFLRALPVELTFHAVGSVASVAVPVFLAADRRLASENASFFFHEYSWTQSPSATLSQTTLAEQVLILNNAVNWTKRILKTRTQINDEFLEAHKMFSDPFIMDAGGARTVGLVGAISEPDIDASTWPVVIA